MYTHAGRVCSCDKIVLVFKFFVTNTKFQKRLQRHAAVRGGARRVC